MLVRKTSLATGIVFVVLLPLWYLVFLPLFVALPVNFSQSAKLTHTQEDRLEIGGKWSAKKILNASIFESVEKTEYRLARLNSDYKVESMDGETLFSLDQKFEVDRFSMKSIPLDPTQSRESYFFYPRHVKKAGLVWWPSTMNSPLEMQFIKETSIDGLRVYHFRGSGSGINQSSEYSSLPLVPGKYLVLSQIKADIYVEPFTGTIVNYRGEGGSYYANLDKTPVWEITKWAHEFSGETVKDRIGKAFSLRNSHFAMEVTGPLVVLLVALILINFGVSRKQSLSRKMKR